MNKILIIEDEEILAKVLEEKLEKHGFSAKIATDGLSGWEMTKDFKPDLILLDLMLPKKDGFEYLKDLKADHNMSRVPVIVLSNLSEDENIKKALKMGVQDYFVKAEHPVNEVIEKVTNALRRGK